MKAGKSTDIRPVEAALHFIPVKTRLPLKFGRETVTDVTWARASLTVADARGRTAMGWGETPLCAQWAWPADLLYEDRHEAMKQFTQQLVVAWGDFPVAGHPIEIGHEFMQNVLPSLLAEANEQRRLKPVLQTPAIPVRSTSFSLPPRNGPIPWLAALICNAAFDIALHDAYGMLHQRPVYETYNADFMNEDLAHFLEPAEDSRVSFAGKFPEEFLVRPRPNQLPAWHLVGGKDPLDESELDGSEPRDGYPCYSATGSRATGSSV